MSTANETLLASFCFVTEDDPQDELRGLIALSQALEARFRYFEIIYVLPERFKPAATALAAQLSACRTLRIVIVRDYLNYYRRRAIAASEAIGDVCVISSFAELPFVDLADFAEDAFARDEIVIGARSRGAGGWTPAYGALTLASPYRVRAKDMKTIALPRRSLSVLASRPSLALDLRFQPKQGGELYIRRPVAVGDTHALRSTNADRLELLEELISASAPRLLRAYALLSALTATAAAAYAIYAVFVVATMADVQAGWFSTAIVQSGSVGFIALGMCVIAIGIANIAERLAGGAHGGVVDEIANIGFFDRTRDLNVEVSARPKSADAER
ncbi:MAG: hypothetical protein GC189_03515 [Alphaproteobacteria bacterium]|nr:hypothetical protein [Alphaproteobacteria bacterium]